MSEAQTERKRRSISPAEKAQQALDVNTRKIETVKQRIAAAKAKVAEIEKELPPLERRQQHLLADPDLPEQPGPVALAEADDGA